MHYAYIISKKGDEMTIEVLALTVSLLFALNAFLYYRWKGLREEWEEKQKSKRIDDAKEYVSNFSWGYASDGSSQTSSSSTSGLVEEAKQALAELKNIAENDVVQLQQKMVSASEKIVVA